MMRTSLAAAVVAGCLSAACAAPPPSGMNDAADIAAVNALRDRFVKAFNSGDAAAIAQTFTEEGVTAANHQPSVTGREAIHAAQKALHDQFNVQLALTPEETHTMDHMGFDRGQYKMTLTPKAAGAAVTDEGRYLVLLEKAGGEWLVAYDMDNSTMPLPAPPPAPAK